MDRQMFLNMCQKEATYNDTQFVYYDNCKYKPMAYQLSFNKTGKVIHTCVLQDANARTVVYADLKRVDAGGK